MRITGANWIPLLHIPKDSHPIIRGYFHAASCCASRPKEKLRTAGDYGQAPY
jgi:hypothetical protein